MFGFLTPSLALKKGSKPKQRAGIILRFPATCSKLIRQEKWGSLSYVLPVFIGCLHIPNVYRYIYIIDVRPITFQHVPPNLCCFMSGQVVRFKKAALTALRSAEFVPFNPLGFPNDAAESK